LLCCCTYLTTLQVSKETTLTALFMGELIKLAGLPPGVVNILTGPGTSLGDAMVEHPLVDKVIMSPAVRL
jgi:acyl-CoA reductase-like NAD-dependent aldehyde dehydrogenase